MHNISCLFMEHRKQALLCIFLSEPLLYRIFLNQSSRLEEQGFPMVGGISPAASVCLEAREELA